jgi:hypothetical protein
MSGYSSGLVPIGKSKSGASGSSSGSRTSLADAPNVLSKTTVPSPRTKNFTHNVSDDDDDNDLDALLQDKPLFAHRTQKNRGALDDSTNSFDDSLSSAGSPMMKNIPKRHNSYGKLRYAR